MSANVYVFGVNHSDFVIGQEKTYQYRGRCPSIGSSIFLFNALFYNRGIFAKARVLETKAEALKFEVTDIKLKGKEIPHLILVKNFPKEKWPKENDCLLHIPILSEHKLPELWDLSQGKHSIAQMLDGFKVVKISGSWYQNYSKYVEWFSSLDGDYSDDDLIKIWSGAENISSIAPQSISKKQCQENLVELREITSLIVDNLDDKAHQRAKALWKEKTSFKSILHVAINRVFAMSNPKLFTSVVSEGKYFPKLYKFLAPALGINTKYGNWVSGNKELKQSLHKIMNIDPIELNVSLWNLVV